MGLSVFSTTSLHWVHRVMNREPAMNDTVSRMQASDCFLLAMQLNDIFRPRLVVKSVDVLRHHGHRPALGLQSRLQLGYRLVPGIGQLDTHGPVYAVLRTNNYGHMACLNLFSFLALKNTFLSMYMLLNTVSRSR